ncbi:MAG TPA: histidine phosphatase family protein [Pseudonocardiaceae bacterium]|jgi:probable phosphoglycerate mutase|nr:histidine phosphatase family protein [Pseudonocardiaceae bacterium]
MSGLRLILARHGQTDANVRMAMDTGVPGGPLTEAGRRQAEELADSLAAEPVAGVYASTMLRAQQTAQPVADRHGLEVAVVSGIEEVFAGDLDRRSDPVSLRAFAEVFRDWLAADGDLTRPMPGGETGQEVLDRATAALAKITAAHDEGAIVVVSHGATMRLVAPALADNLDTVADEISMLQNTARIVLEVRPSGPGGWHCVEWAGVRLATAT